MAKKAGRGGRVQVIVIEKKKGSKVYRWEERKGGGAVRKEQIPLKSDKVRLAIIPAGSSSGPKLEAKDYHVYPLTSGKLRVHVFKNPGDKKPVSTYRHSLKPHKGYRRSVKRGKYVKTANEGDGPIHVLKG